MSEDIEDLDRRHVWHPFTQSADAPAPEVVVSGRGALLRTAAGEEILDLISSWWVNLHGHAHPVIAGAVAAQAAMLEQVVFAEFTHAPAARLAARLAALLPGDLDRVFFSDDGSTAVEAGLKIALQYFGNIGQAGRRRLLAFDGGYHGDTVGAMSLGRSSGYFQAWDDLLFPVEVLPFPATWRDDPEAGAREAAALADVERALDGTVAAVIVEPLVQGAGGMRMCRPAFLQALAERVHACGALLIFDEVMTGFGRTGAPFACLTAGVQPDIVCLSKGLTGGFLPMGATVVRQSVHQAFVGGGIKRAFLHGHSYTANPLGCAAGLASLELLTGADCQARIAAIAALHGQRLAALPAGASRPRQTGTIAAVDIGEGGYGGTAAAALKAFFRDHRMLVRPLGATLYFMPPYCIPTDDLHRAWDVLAAAAGS
ncbi:MAG TPA: adenosylmethionine--8-amino-7-oxononanoate transaminase [Rhodospirillaceae bacterium]|nr:adenosylmethionine--8-amino-7-oxononanoate transaminase [Rhodospirillaceae bacterium]